MSIRSITSCVSSFATIVRPSGARNASSAANAWPAGTASAVGKRHQMRPVRSMARMRPLPRSATRKPPGKVPPADEPAVAAGPAAEAWPGCAGPPAEAPGSVAPAWVASRVGAAVGAATAACPQAATMSRIAPVARRAVRRGMRGRRVGSFMAGTVPAGPAAWEVRSRTFTQFARRRNPGAAASSGSPPPWACSAGGRVGGLGRLVLLEPPLRVDRRSAAVPGGGHRLAVAMVVDVAGDEDPLDPGVGFVLDDQVALLVLRKPALEGRGIRPVADRDEEARDGEIAGRPGRHVAQPHAGDRLLAEHLVHGHAAVDLDAGMALRAGLHDPAGPELGTPVEEVDLRRETGQVEGLLQGSVAAPDHGDRLVAEEEAVAGRAGRDAVPTEPLLGFEAQPERRGAGRHDDGLGTVFDAGGPGVERTTGEVDPLDLHVDHAGPEALGLGAEAGHQLGTLDPLREARVVLHFARDRELAAGL